MSTPTTIKTALQAAIRKANNTTGAGDTTVTDAVDSLIEGYGKGGIEPQGSITITQNGTYDVTEKAEAVVNVPASGITPSGSIAISENGEFDVTSFAKANVNIQGLNARIFTATLNADTTSTANFLTDNWLKEIRAKSNAFVLLRYLGMKASTAAVNAVLTANFPLSYGGATMYNSMVMRSTTSANNVNPNTKGLSGGEQYNGHLMIDTNGKLFAYGNATYPFKAGQYQIIAGTVEML
jgi:hypothetical protein